MTVPCVTALAINESCLWIGTNIGLLLRIPIVIPTAVNASVSSKLQFIIFCVVDLEKTIMKLFFDN